MTDQRNKQREIKAGKKRTRNNWKRSSPGAAPDCRKKTDKGVRQKAMEG